MTHPCSEAAEAVAVAVAAAAAAGRSFRPLPAAPTRRRRVGARLAPEGGSGREGAAAPGGRRHPCILRRD